LPPDVRKAFGLPGSAITYFSRLIVMLPQDEPRLFLRIRTGKATPFRTPRDKAEETIALHSWYWLRLCGKSLRHETTSPVVIDSYLPARAGVRCIGNSYRRAAPGSVNTKKAGATKNL
jgi:hypothetical protein